ncbi:MAG: hydrogenase maturation nickel metallochaperone HypA [Solirubrobacterales bacterium]
MHELSIAQAVLDTVERHAAGRRVTRVELEVGHLRQVVPSALSFAFELITPGTVAEGAELELREVPAAGLCRSCEAETTLADLPLRCERCGGFELELIRGEELLIDSLEVEEELVSSKA